MTTVLAFILTLGVLIVIHEYGHYRVARAFGVKVLRFSVGFGRVIWRRQRSPDDTEIERSVLDLEVPGPEVERLRRPRFFARVGLSSAVQPATCAQSALVIARPTSSRVHTEECCQPR